MAHHRRPNVSLLCLEGNNADTALPHVYSQATNSSRLEIEDDLRAMERLQRAERLCAAQEARINAVLERMALSIQKGPLPSAEPSASSGQDPESSDITNELGAISWSESPTPSPPPQAPTSKKPCVTVRIGADEQRADGHTAESAEIRTKDNRGIQFNGLSSPKPPAAPERTADVKPQHGTIHSPKTVQCDLHPLVNASQSLSLCFKQLRAVDWEKKIEGLKIIKALARHHRALLMTKLHRVCLVVTAEVKNGRCCVASAAIDTIRELHVHLGKSMNPELDWTGCVLLLKLAQTTQTFIHQRVNLALDALVKGCSPGRVVMTLVNFGLSHQSHRVRESTALHLLQLTEIIGEKWVTAERYFTERFLTAVCKLSLDSATGVRLHGKEMLKKLGHQSQLEDFWTKVVPKKDRHHLEKILGPLGSSRLCDGMSRNHQM